MHFFSLRFSEILSCCGQGRVNPWALWARAQGPPELGASRRVAVVTLLAERGLAFRGDNQTIGSPNNGNFLGVLELVAQFDPFLAKHIEDFGNAGRGTPSYFSSTIIEEFIDIMAQQVRQTIVQEVAAANTFYSDILVATRHFGLKYQILARSHLE